MGECRREQSPDSRRRPENDEHWASADPEWVGKASMGQRHRFMLVRDLSWNLFNVLAFGLQSVVELRAAVDILQVRATTGWAEGWLLRWHAPIARPSSLALLACGAAAQRYCTRTVRAALL